MTSVAFLVDQLFSPVAGGMGTYIRELLPALARAEPSLEVTLFHSRIDHEARAAARQDGFMPELPRVELSGSIRQLYPSWALARRPALPPLLAALDLIHTPVPAAIPPAGTGQRLVVTVHDLAFLFHPKFYPRQWRLMYRVGLGRAVRSADAVIADSRHTAEDLIHRTRIDPRKVHVVPLAAALPETSSDVDETLGRLKVPMPYVLFVGTLEPRKNLVRLVRAYRRMAVRGSPHALVLAGPIGWRHQALLREIALDGPGEIILTGATGPEDLDALYRGAAAFVYPSLYEGFGLPVLEAMARGVPCVVSTSSSLPEVAGEAALPVHPRSVAGLTEAMERVTGDRDLAERLRIAGRARAGRFSWEETARLTLEVYKWVL